MTWDDFLCTAYEWMFDDDNKTLCLDFDGGNIIECEEHENVETSADIPDEVLVGVTDEETLIDVLEDYLRDTHGSGGEMTFTNGWEFGYWWEEGCNPLISNNTGERGDDFIQWFAEHHYNAVGTFIMRKKDGTPWFVGEEMDDEKLLSPTLIDFPSAEVELVDYEEGKGYYFQDTYLNLSPKAKANLLARAKALT